MSGTKKLLSRLICALLALSLCGCGFGGGGEKLNKYEDVFYGAFDSTVTFTAYCESQERFEELFAQVQREFMRYHRLFDIYFSYSGLNNLKTVNDSAGKAPVEVDGEIIELLELGREMYELTDGEVNIALGSVLSIWHDVREYNNAPDVEKKLPDADALRAAAEHCSIDNVIIDKAAHTVYLSDGDMSVDVGAIAKGFAAEKIARLLESDGVTATINAGGNVRTVGVKPSGEGWHIGVTNPDVLSAQAYVDVVEVPGSAAIVTSGVYQRYFEYEGRRYHHIIDKDTLMPEERYLSVTVITADSGCADALSTALFNMDADAGADFVAGLDGVEALWVLPDGTVKRSDGVHTGK